MKKLIYILGITLLSFGLCACSSETSVANDSETIEEEVVAEATSETAEEEVKAPEITDISDTEKSIYFYRDDMKMSGKMHLPEGEGPFPAVIMAGGFGASYTYIEEHAKFLARNGIASVVFSFIGDKPSDGPYLDKTVLTEVEDLNLVFDSILNLPEIDQNQIFLWGHSFGGLVTTYVASQRADEIQGVLLVEPSYSAHDQFNELYPEGSEIPFVITEPLTVGRAFVEDITSFNIYDMMADCDKEVLIFMGDVDEGGEVQEQLEYYGKALETFPSAQIITIEGADHYFQGEPGQKMIEATLDFVKTR